MKREKKIEITVFYSCRQFRQAIERIEMRHENEYNCFLVVVSRYMNGNEVDGEKICIDKSKKQILLHGFVFPYESTDNGYGDDLEEIFDLKPAIAIGLMNVLKTKNRWSLDEADDPIGDRWDKKFEKIIAPDIGLEKDIQEILYNPNQIEIPFTTNNQSHTKKSKGKAARKSSPLSKTIKEKNSAANKNTSG